MAKAQKDTVKKKAAKKPAKHPAKGTGKRVPKRSGKSGAAGLAPSILAPAAPLQQAQADAAVLDRLWEVVTSRRSADPSVSHSARLLARGTAKVAQKFGEEAVECVIEAIAGDRDKLIAESADVLYHLIVVWVNAGVRSEEVWAELTRREGVSGIDEKAARAVPLALRVETRKIP